MAFGIVAVAYIVFILWLFSGWRKALSGVKGLTESELTFSVIIPIRNEADNIQNLLLDLSEQTYNSSQFEVIVVDDHSDDESMALVQALTLPYQLTILKAKGQGKKQAITQGVNHASNTIILTTDGDCRVNKQWIQSYATVYDNSPKELVFGAVTFYSEQTFFQRLQAIEFASLVGSGIATLSLKKPSMCNGANISFKKTLFEQLEGYASNAHIASGDDEFLMHQAYLNNSEAVGVNMEKGNVVYTQASGTLSEFTNQRKRWASKWGSYKVSFPKVLAALVFCFNLAFTLSIVFYFRGDLDLYTFSTVLASKVCMDFVFIKSVMNYLGKTMNVAVYLFLSIVYPLYVCVFGILGSFGKYAWKGRTY